MVMTSRPGADMRLSCAAAADTSDGSDFASSARYSDRS